MVISTGDWQWAYVKGKLRQFLSGACGLRRIKRKYFPVDRIDGQCSQEAPCARPSHSRHRQGGAIAILFGLMLLGIMGLIGMALDLALVYNRKAELQMLADATALAAASQLNGKDTGVSNALVKAAKPPPPCATSTTTTDRLVRRCAALQ
jgi:hypothetical protein